MSKTIAQIDAGNDPPDPRPGLLSLSAHSLGQRGLDTQLPGGSLQSDIVGALKAFKLADGPVVIVRFLSIRFMAIRAQTFEHASRSF